MKFVIAKYNKKISITSAGIKHVADEHPEIGAMAKEIEETLGNPDFVRSSNYKNDVWLYYRFYAERKKYLVVVGEYLMVRGYFSPVT